MGIFQDAACPAQAALRSHRLQIQNLSNEIAQAEDRRRRGADCAAGEFSGARQSNRCAAGIRRRCTLVFAHGFYEEDQVLYTSARARGPYSEQGGLAHAMPAMVSDNRNPELVWDFMRGGIAQRALSLTAFAALYTALVLLGLDLRESSEQLTILWPAAGLLVMTLWFAPLRCWCADGSRIRKFPRFGTCCASSRRLPWARRPARCSGRSVRRGPWRAPSTCVNGSCGGQGTGRGRCASLRSS